MRTGKNFLDVLNGQKTERVPFWFMRQAGRYLPEYRELRAKAGGFLKMVYDPKTAAEITMQPIRRFGMDAAIIFSDILVIPQALGQKLEFMEGEGPKLEPLSNFGKLNFKNFESVLAPVYESLTRVKTELSTKGFNSTALIGFCGAPWTVASYMVEGGGSKDFHRVKALAYSDPEGFSNLIGTLVEASTMYLLKQIAAGAEAVQIFDSWAGILDPDQFAKWVIKPTKDMVKSIRQQHPNVPVIGFPRAAGQNYLAYVQETGVTAVGIDTQVPPKWAARTLQPLVPVQGNLDPACLYAGGDALTLATEKILTELSGGPFVFNLGHGVHKDTPVEHVEALVKLIKDYMVQS
jgi:uroporphyrinogen decarboxylase